MLAEDRRIAQLMQNEEVGKLRFAAETSCRLVQTDGYAMQFVAQVQAHPELAVVMQASQYVWLF